MAYIFIDRWDIKPLNYKNPPGFISDKIGFAEEYRILRKASALGAICLLADITNVLRHGDVYAFRADRFPLIMEVKKKKKLNPRGIKQRNRLEQLSKYLRTDKTSDFLGKNIHAFRVEPSKPDKYYLKALNRSIDKAYVKGSHIEAVEDGLYYAASTTDEPSFISKTIEQCYKPTVFLLNAAKVNCSCYPYYPIALSIKDPMAILDFYHGQIIILVIVDLEVVIKSLKKDNIACRLLENSEFLLELTSTDQKVKGFDGPLQVSRTFFAKIGYEFLSLKWLLSLRKNAFGDRYNEP